MSKYEWYQLRSTNLEALADMRDQVHVAIQNVALIGRQYLPKSKEDENATLSWIPGLWRMAGKWIDDNSFRSSLSLRDFHLYLVDGKLNIVDELKLHGANFKETMLWLERNIGAHDLGHKSLSIELPYDFDLLKVKGSQPFIEFDERQYEDFGGFYHNAFIVCQDIKSAHKNTSEIKIWPHHFDLATMITLIDIGDPSLNTSVSVGFSPGDAQHPEPYFYVNSWPHANAQNLGALPQGSFWNTNGWVGGVLPISSVWKTPHQKELVLDFYHAAINALKNTLLG